jgi:predicted transposase YbfD/YdcC
MLLKEAEYSTPWEPYQGNLIRYKLYRSNEMADWETDGGKWEHLRQVWMVVPEIKRQIGPKKKGRKSHRDKPLYAQAEIGEVRYYLSNLPWNYFTPTQILAAVRGHWKIENNGHWTLDVIWNEDAAPWCRQNDALLVLAILRAMAITTLRWLKSRHIRNIMIDSMGWREFLALINDIMAICFKPPRTLTPIPLRE